jgi:hypothetical protein
LKGELTIIGAIVVMLIGIGISIGALTYFPSPRVAICTGNGKVYSYSIDPYYEPALRQMLGFLVFGCVLLGLSLGILANTYATRRSEKRLPQSPPPSRAVLEFRNTHAHYTLMEAIMALHKLWRRSRNTMRNVNWFKVVDLSSSL